MSDGVIGIVGGGGLLQYMVVTGMGGEGKGHGVRCLRRDGIELEWYSPLNLIITSTSFLRTRLRAQATKVFAGKEPPSLSVNLISRSPIYLSPNTFTPNTPSHTPPNIYLHPHHFSITPTRINPYPNSPSQLTPCTQISKNSVRQSVKSTTKFRRAKDM